MLSKRSGYKMKTPRYAVLTDILDGFEVDDIQSMIRLMLYSNDIDIEALICCTSCFVKGNVSGRVGLIHRIIDAYGETLPNLSAHAPRWRSADYYHSITFEWIDEYGLMPGFGFARDFQRKSLRWIADMSADPNCAAVLCSHDPDVKPGVITI